MRMPRWMARSSKAKMFGRPKLKSKIISAVQVPIPLSEVSAAIALSSGEGIIFWTLS